MKKDLFHKFRDLVHKTCGIYLSEAKESLISSRLARRIRELGLGSEESYYELLCQAGNDEEIIVFVDLISTNVTSFFREPDHFDLLKNVFQTWRKRGVNQLRIWSAGCSSGEEPYTIAMLAKEHLPTYCDTRILATDISTRVLGLCVHGQYEEAKMESIPKDFLKRHFVRRQGEKGLLYKAAPHLRDMILFRRLNLIQQPLPVKGPLDIIFCRNVMIYFDQALRQRLIDQFYGLLKPGGVLFISHTESLAGILNTFQMKLPSVFIKPTEAERKDYAGQQHAN